MKKIEMKSKFLTITIVVIAALLVLSCAKSDGVEDGKYINQEYGFSLEIPDGWKVILGKRADNISQIDGVEGVSGRMVITPDNPDSNMLSVAIMELSQKQFEEVPWEEFVKTLKNNVSMDIETEAVLKIDGLDVYHAGGVTARYHMDFNLFTTNKQVIQIFYYVTRPVDNDVMQQMAETLYSLKKLD